MNVLYRKVTYPHSPLRNLSYTDVRKEINKDGLMLKHVEDQKDELCELAVFRNGLALQHVNVQTEKIVKIAIQQNKDAMKFVWPEFIHLFN